MDRTDAVMMEAESSARPAPASNRNTGGGDAVGELLGLARQLSNQGKPSEALQPVAMAMRTKGGDVAVFESLHRARELYRTRLRENAAMDQLASLFAECAIAEDHPSQT